MVLSSTREQRSGGEGDRRARPAARAAGEHTVERQAIGRQGRAGLIRTDPKGEPTYRRNAKTLLAELTALDQRYRTGLANCAIHTIVTSHEAFGYLAKRYHLEQQGAAGLSPDA